MQTMEHEQTGLPDTSFVEDPPDVPFLGDLATEDRPGLIAKAQDSIKKIHPKFKFQAMGPLGFNKNWEIVLKGPKGRERRILRLKIRD